MIYLYYWISSYHLYVTTKLFRGVLSAWDPCYCAVHIHLLKTCLGTYPTILFAIHQKM